MEEPEQAALKWSSVGQEMAVVCSSPSNELIMAHTIMEWTFCLQEAEMSLDTVRVSCGCEGKKYRRDVENRKEIESDRPKEEEGPGRRLKEANRKRKPSEKINLI